MTRRISVLIPVSLALGSYSSVTSVSAFCGICETETHKMKTDPKAPNRKTRDPFEYFSEPSDSVSMSIVDSDTLSSEAEERQSGSDSEIDMDKGIGELMNELKKGQTDFKLPEGMPEMPPEMEGLMQDFLRQINNP